MGIENVIGSLFGNRVTYGTNLELQDGNLVIEDQLFPNRVALMGVCSNSERDPENPDEYLIPNNQPTPIAKLEDLNFIRNGDPDNTPSEIMLAFRDAYDGGARTFEVVILGRQVVQLGGDIDDDDTIIPVSTIYTGSVSRMENIGSHPTLNTHFAAFSHNGMMFAAGGERPNTPALGDITTVAVASLAAGDFFHFAHADGRIHGFWFNVGGSDPEPAALATLVASGTAGSTSTEIDVSGVASADEVRDAVAVAIETNTQIPLTAYDGGAATVDLESDEAGVLGNQWTLIETVTNAGFLVTTPSGGSGTHSISTRVVKFDPDTSLWTNATDAAGIPLRLVLGVRSAAAVRASATVVQVVGGMTSIQSAADVATDEIQAITFTGAASSDLTSIADAGFDINTDHTDLGEALFVEAGGTVYIFGGNTGSGATVLSDMVATYNPVDGQVDDTTEVLPAAVRLLGGYHEPVSNRIYVFGGQTAGGADDTTHVWDVAAVEFMPAGTAGRMTQKKHSFATITLNDSAYVFGGALETGPSNRIDRFDPDSLTWSNRSLLVDAASGGGAVVISNRVYYADSIQGGKYNVGIGNLADPFVGFPEASTLGTTPFLVQLEWEIMRVVGYGTTRARGRDTDAIIVQRAQKGSTAISHFDRADITHDPEFLHTQLSNAFEEMTGLSRADYIVMPARATADCPYLPATQNFAYLAGLYAAFKTIHERVVLVGIGVHPPTENPRSEYTRTQEAVWANHLVNYDRLNFEGQPTWKIGDGVTDNNGDNKPDTYALWFTRDGQIPTGSPPMDSGSVERDSNDRPIDLGKHLVVVAAYGFATGREYRDKFTSAGRGYLRSGHAQFTGMLSVLDAAVGSTGAPARGFTPVRPLTLQAENSLVRNRYIIVVQRTNGFRWSNGFTFSYNVSRTSRSDWVFASSVRRAAGLTRAIRRIIDIYAGKGTDRQTQTAMDVDISQKIQNFVAGGVVGERTNHRTEIDEDDAIMGHARVYLNIQIPGELMTIDMIAALDI